MQSWIEKISVRPYRAILLLGLVLLLSGNWILPLTDRDEDRFAEASREMLQRGDYVVPWFNGEWRFDKPVFIYWCQMASFRLFGESDFTARLPSVLFTTATALLLVRWGKKIADARTGFFAGAMFLAGLHIAIIGRVATADLAMIFFFTLAVWSGWELTRPEPDRRPAWWWLFYVTLALGFLAKGPVAWFPLGVLILGRWRRPTVYRLPTGETLVGLVVTLALVGCWGIPAVLQTHDEYVDVGLGEHVVFRSVGVINGHGLSGALGFLATLPLYFLTFFISFFPWSTRVPGALRRWWPERKQDEVGAYLFAQIALVFVIFSLVRTKLPHYTLPAFPCIALWLARVLAGQPGSAAWLGRRLAGMTILVLLVTLVGFTLFQPGLLTEKLWKQLKPHVRPETRVASYGFIEPSLVWRFRSIITNTVLLGSVDQAKYFLTNPPPWILILPTKDVAGLPDTNGLQFQVHGLDLVKFRNRDLTAILRE